MNRAEKIEAIRKVYGDKAVEDNEKWDYRLPSESLNVLRGINVQFLDSGHDWIGGAGNAGSMLYRYPRELPKPKCITEDVEVKWDGFRPFIGNGLLDPYVGYGFTWKSHGWQIAGFLFEGGESRLLSIMCEGVNSYIRANRVRLVRWE